jgi:acetoin utilization protein AcuB
MKASDRTVESAMQRDPVCVEPEARLDFVDDIMRLGRVRHMPVVSNGVLVGIVSQRDLLAASLTKVLDFDPQARRTFMRSVEVSEAMTKNPVAVSGSESLREAAKLLLERKIGCLPVVDAQRRVIGLLTETDLLRAAYE